MKTVKFDINRIFREPDHFLLAPQHLREDKEFIKKCSNENGGDFFVYVDDRFKQDEDFVFENSSLHSSPLYLKEYKGYTFCKCLWGKSNYFSIHRQYRYFDKDIALAIAYEGRNLDHYSPEFAFNKTSAFHYTRYFSNNYENLKPKFQNNIYLAMVALTDDCAIDIAQYKKVIKNRLFCQMYLIYDAKNVLKVPKKFQMEAKFVQHVLAHNPDFYPYLNAKFKDQEKYLTIALNAQHPKIHGSNHSKYGIKPNRSTKPGDLLLSAPEKFHSTKNLYRAAILDLSNLNGYKGKISLEIARKLVELNPRNFHALRDTYKRHDLIIRTTIRKYPEIIVDIDPKHSNYKAYAKIALQVDGSLLRYINENTWTDALICIALKSSGYSFNYLNDQLKDNEKFIKIALKQSGEIFKEIPLRHQSNHEIIGLALKNKPAVYEYLPTVFKNDIEICEYVYTKLPRMMEFMPKKCLTKKIKIIAALHKDGSAWEFLPNKLKQDHTLIHIATDQNPLILAKIYIEKEEKFPLEYLKMENKKTDLYAHLPLMVRNDPELALDAIKLNIDNIYFLPVALMKNDKFMQKLYKIFRKKCKRQWKMFKHNCDQLVA